MRIASICIIVAIPLAVAIYDIIAFAVGGVDATISRVLRDAANEYPITAFLAGFITGGLASHFYWWQPPPPKS